MSRPSPKDIHYPHNLGDTWEEIRRARRYGETRYFECRSVHRHGHPVLLAWIGVWSNPEQQHFFIGRDISERLARDAAVKALEEGTPRSDSSLSTLA